MYLGLFEWVLFINSTSHHALISLPCRFYNAWVLCYLGFGLPYLHFEKSEKENLKKKKLNKRKLGVAYIQKWRVSIDGLDVSLSTGLVDSFACNKKYSGITFNYHKLSVYQKSQIKLCANIAIFWCRNT